MVTYGATGITCSVDCGGGALTIPSIPGAAVGAVVVCVSVLDVPAGLTITASSA